jgi:hypothetical protein
VGSFSLDGDDDSVVVAASSLRRVMESGGRQVVRLATASVSPEMLSSVARRALLRLLGPRGRQLAAS